jgi:hypothetical protein
MTPASTYTHYCRPNLAELFHHSDRGGGVHGAPDQTALLQLVSASSRPHWACRDGAEQRRVGHDLGTISADLVPPRGQSLTSLGQFWRRRPDLNRGWRFCRPSARACAETHRRVPTQAAIVTNELVGTLRVGTQSPIERAYGRPRGNRRWARARCRRRPRKGWWTFPVAARPAPLI